MKKLLSALSVVALSVSMMACSSTGGPSSSEVKKQITEKLEKRTSSEEMKKSIQVNHTECEPTSTEGEYFCTVAVSMVVDGERDKQVSGWKFAKANDAWFMRGPFLPPKEARERAMK